eukprot:6190023-Pleurochrysis_carterae.AAC.1
MITISQYLHLRPKFAVQPILTVLHMPIAKHKGAHVRELEGCDADENERLPRDQGAGDRAAAPYHRDMPPLSQENGPRGELQLADAERLGWPATPAGVSVRRWQGHGLQDDGAWARARAAQSWRSYEPGVRAPCTPARRCGAGPVSAFPPPPPSPPPSPPSSVSPSAEAPNEPSESVADVPPPAAPPSQHQALVLRLPAILPNPHVSMSRRAPALSPAEIIHKLRS